MQRIMITIDGYRLRGNLHALPFGYCSHGPHFACFSTPYNSTNNTTFHHISFSSPLTSHSSDQYFGLCTSQTSATPTSPNDYVGGYLLPNFFALRHRSAANIHVSDFFASVSTLRYSPFQLLSTHSKLIYRSPSTLTPIQSRLTTAAPSALPTTWMILKPRLVAPGLQP